MPISRQVQIKPLPTRTAGFSLVEIMVGMVIGLLGIIVMMNLFSNFEAQKRTTAGASEVQNDGAISLFSMQRDLQQAGFGISSVNLVGCGVTVPKPLAAPFNPPAQFTLPAIAPVTINSALVPAGDNNTDTLLIVYGNGNGQPEGDNISSYGNGPPSTILNLKYPPSSATALDQVLFQSAVRPAACNLTVYTVGQVTTPNITLTTAITIAASPGSVGTLFVLGNPPNGNPFRVVAYAVRGGALQSCDYMQTDCTGLANWLTLARGIVSMRAQYGIDTSGTATAAPSFGGPPMDGIVDKYAQTTPNAASSTYACDWMRISSVRIALVGRNDQPNKDPVTTAVPTWSGSVANPINLVNSTPAGAALDWTHYRYKVFETTVPLRNISIKGAVSGC